MKVLVYSPVTWGGVRRVAEAISHGLVQHGCSVKVVYGVRGVLSFLVKNDFWNYAYIASLHGGLFSPLFRRSIFVMHGFPAVGHQGIFRFFAVWFGCKVASLISGKTVSVSYLTSIVNRSILAISSDKVIHNCINPVATKSHQRAARSKRVVFVGRVEAAKGVRQIIEGFLDFSRCNQNYSLVVVGDGSDLPSLKQDFGFDNIEYVGYIGDAGDLIDLYDSSEIFISLNDFEPFGLVFLEAMSCGLKIVAPSTGGQLEFIPVDYPSFLVDDVLDFRQVSSALTRAAMFSDPVPMFDAELYSPKNVAGRYLELLRSIR